MFGMLWWILGLAAAVWVIYDVATSQKKMKPERKLLWIIAAIVFSIITAIIYYFAVKSK